MRRHQAHVDVVSLAELREGLIGGGRAARIRRHLAGCEHCAGTEAGLTRVTALLTAVPQPVMPDRLARRVTEALAAEAAARDLRANLAVPQEALNGHDRLRHAERVRALTRPLSGRARLASLGFAGAAAACLLAAGGYALTRLEPPAPADGHVIGTGARPGPMVAGPHRAGNGARSHPHNVKPTAAPFMVVRSDTDFQPIPRLTQQVEQELAALAFGTGQQAGQADGGGQTAALDTCVKRVTGGATPTLVDIARYEGRPASIIVYGNQVKVVSPNCTVLTRASLRGSP